MGGWGSGTYSSSILVPPTGALCPEVIHPSDVLELGVSREQRESRPHSQPPGSSLGHFPYLSLYWYRLGNQDQGYLGRANQTGPLGLCGVTGSTALGTPSLLPKTPAAPVSSGLPPPSGQVQPELDPRPVALGRPAPPGLSFLFFTPANACPAVSPTTRKRFENGPGTIPRPCAPSQSG